jgi:hypothetical protein
MIKRDGPKGRALNNKIKEFTTEFKNNGIKPKRRNTKLKIPNQKTTFKKKKENMKNKIMKIKSGKYQKENS